MRPVSKIISAARAEHYKLTLPWQHGENVRLLTVPMYDQHEAAMLELYEEFNDASRGFLDAYDDHIDEARTRLGKMFDESQYPPKFHLADKFRFKWNISPLPKGEHLTVNISNKRLREIRREMEQSVEASFTAAVGDCYKRLGRSVQAIVDRLQDGEDGYALTFRDTLITNLGDLVDVVPKLNVTGDPVLADLVEDCRKKLLIAKPNELRPLNAEFDAKKRKAVIRDAKRLSETFAGYFGAAA